MLKVVGDVVHKGLLCSSVLSVLSVPHLQLALFLYYSMYCKKSRVRDWALKVRDWASPLFKVLEKGVLLWKTFLTSCNNTSMHTKGEKLGILA